MAVRIVESGRLSSPAQQEALKIGRTYEKRGLFGKRYVPATGITPALIISGDGDGGISIIPAGDILPPIQEFAKINPVNKAVLLTHGVVSSYFLGPPASPDEAYNPDEEQSELDKAIAIAKDKVTRKPVKVRKSNSYDAAWREDETPQVTMSADEQQGFPDRYEHALFISKYAHKWSHFITLKSSQYSGWMRHVVQCALGQGFGQNGLNEKYFPTYNKVNFDFSADRTDGVIFPPPPDNAQPGFTPSVPVLVRMDVVRQRTLVGPMTFWHEALVVKEKIKRQLTSTQIWAEYLKIAKSYDTDENRKEDSYDYIIETIAKFGGIPTYESVFNLSTNIPEKKGGLVKAREQRIKAGLITEIPYEGDITIQNISIQKDRPWAFAYDRPIAAHVFFKYDGTKGIYKGELYWADFQIENGVIPSHPQSYPNLDSYLSNWVGEGELDYIAKDFFMARLTHSVLKDYDDRLGTDFDPASQSIFNDFIKDAEVLPENKVYKCTTKPTVLREDYFVNWKRGTKQVMDCEIKTPDYIQGGVTSIGAPSIDIHDVPSGSVDLPAISPLDIFFTYDGGTIMTDMVSIPPDPSTQEIEGGPGPCGVSNWTRTTSTLSTTPYTKFVRTNVFDPSDNTRVEAQTITDYTVEPLFDKYSINDSLIDPGRGHISKRKYFRAKSVTESYGYDAGGIGCVFPSYEREAVFIGVGPTGSHEHTKTTSYDIPIVGYAYSSKYERCFPGYWARSPEYFSCQAENNQSCPSFPGDPYNQVYNRTISFPNIYYSPDACNEAWGMQEKIFFKCQDADALYNSTKDLEAFRPPGFTETIKADKSVYVYAHSSILGEEVEKSVKREHEEAPKFPAFWTSPSPDPDTGNLAYFSAVSSNMGKRAMVSYSDIGGGELYFVGITDKDEEAKYTSAAASFIGSALGKNPDEEA